MKIQAGNKTIAGVEIYSERIWHEDVSRPALRLELNGGISDDELSALTAGEISVKDDSGNVQGEWNGYNTVVRHELVIAQIKTLEQMESERDAALHEASHAQAETAQVRGAFAEVVPLMADNAQMINAAASLLTEWTEGSYKIGDVRMYEGIPYKCIQAHDSTGNAGWTPSATPALWMQYHGTSAESARPWIAPTGAHDIYKSGEYMIFTDNKTYKCKSDTNFSPTDYAQAWEVQ